MSRELADATASFLGARSSRRSFLVRMAIVGSALTVAPLRYVLKPGTAYAAVCGPGSSCGSGYTAMCCTVSGDNSCPPGSFPGGWWKSDNSNLCCGGARYYIDCNMQCGQSCGCHCASGSCDQRKVCCNQFRYGQCHQEIACYGPIVCRVVSCNPPWMFDPSCSADVRVDNATAEHSAPCLPGCPPPEPPPSPVPPTPTTQPPSPLQGVEKRLSDLLKRRRLGPKPPGG